MIAVEVVPDRFNTAANSISSTLSNERNGKASNTNNHIRRPTNGIQLKDDTFATLRVVAGNGNPIKIVDAGSRRKDGAQKFFEVNGKRATDIYSNFFIQSIQEERVEKTQILETFGEPYIFLFGERARIISFAGSLLNTFDFNWEAEWWYNYENYLRGSRCVENDARVFLSFDETLVSGYIIASGATKSSDNPYIVNFQFQMFVTSYTTINNRIGNPSAYPSLSKRLNHVTSNQLDVARPKLITNSVSGTLDVDGALQDPNFFEAVGQTIGTAIGAVTGLLRSASSIVNSVTSNLSNLLNGTLVRVPTGFEGDLVYDDADRVVQYLTVNKGGAITYTTFDQNEAEYVGSSSHYGDSISSDGVVRYNFGTGSSTTLSNGSSYSLTARAIWKANGFEVPNSYLGKVERMLVSKGMGIVSTGISKAWQTKGNLADKFAAGFGAVPEAVLTYSGVGAVFTTAQQIFNFGPVNASDPPPPSHTPTPIPRPTSASRHGGTSDIEHVSS